MARIYSSSSEIMRVKGSAFGGLQVCGVEETLTTSVTSGGKAGVWRKEEERKGMREEKSSNVVIARSSFPFVFFSILIFFSLDKTLFKASNFSIQGS